MKDDANAVRNAWVCWLVMVKLKLLSATLATGIFLIADKRNVASLLILLLVTNAANAKDLDINDWSSIEDLARGETVYFNAWGGETRINRYLSWAATTVKSRYDINLQHVKIADTAQAVSRVLAEKQAGNNTDGAIDLLWINGENFSALKQNQLLYGPWAEYQPNFPLVNADRFPEMREDFSIATDGLESPWTRSQLVFYYDSSVISGPPLSISELLSWAVENPSEFIYPRPPSFLGTTFLKQAILELSDNVAALYLPVSASNFDEITAPLWEYLDALHPNLLRSGRYFPSTAADLRRHMGDGEISLALAFNPNEAALAISSGELPKSARSYVLQGGTISNVSFLAIPFNSPHKAAAMVVSNFLLSPEAQSRASDPVHMGSTTVLSIEDLPDEARKMITAIDYGSAAVSIDDLNRKLREPHPSWTLALEQAWVQRYSAK